MLGGLADDATAKPPISMSRQPAINAEVLRKEDTARCEDMYLKLQLGVSDGDPRLVDAVVRVLAHKAKLNGHAVEPEQGSGVFAARPRKPNPNIGNALADALDSTSLASKIL